MNKLFFISCLIFACGCLTEEQIKKEKELKNKAQEKYENKVLGHSIISITTDNGGNRLDWAETYIVKLDNGTILRFSQDGERTDSAWVGMRIEYAE